ncbi:hypothetical protein [Roseovarius indicus]|uniref:Uncharacterized protein n=1 Tax=Roseovarius indicus TaxID=540747 RepID=A0A5P3AF38_9RHOB|nr:hypothetical protein [Roseovarius indicus]QEW27821.1 hypothetical protein RIdsm_03641 [Roseovarius indicus]SFE79890.1 hypothetical protein SAMN04488031_12247 [Roseovarius indicus]
MTQNAPWRGAARPAFTVFSFVGLVIINALLFFREQIHQLIFGTGG